MARVYVSKGDTVVVQNHGREYPFLVSGEDDPSGKWFGSMLCEGCQQNEGYGEPTDAALLCPRCVRIGLTDILVRGIIDHAEEVYPMLERIQDALGRLERQGRESGIAYVDNRSSAFDALQGMTDEDLKEDLWSAYGDALRTLRDTPNVRRFL